MRQVCVRHRLRVALSLLMAAPLAMAGRPLASEDASTADAGSCQLEAWAGRIGAAGSTTLAPACGLLPGLELDADLSVFSPRGSQPRQAGLALKWVPSAVPRDTAAGSVHLGAKLSGAWATPAGAAWHASQTTALVVLTLKPGDAMALHANLGATHDHASGKHASLLNLALAWAPHDALLLFCRGPGQQPARGVWGHAAKRRGTLVAGQGHGGPGSHSRPRGRGIRHHALDAGAGLVRHRPVTAGL